MSTVPQFSNFVFLRHGLSEANRDGIVQGQFDYKLTEGGEKQVDALIRFWIKNERKFDGAISSPLIRAKDTAHQIATAMKINLEIDDIWQERHLGEAQGMPYEQAIEWYSERPRWSPFERSFGSGESEWQLHMRACQAIEQLIHLDPGQYLIVSHGGFLGAVLRAILGLSPSSGRTRPIRISFSNTGYAELRYEYHEARWYIDSLNSTPHL